MVIVDRCVVRFCVKKMLKLVGFGGTAFREYPPNN